MLLVLFASLAVCSTAVTTLLPAETIFAFPNTTFYDIENVAVRPNGHILLNLLSQPSIYSLNPNAHKPNATLVHTFENATKLDGIVEYKHDVFAVIAGAALSNGSSTYAIWSIDFNDHPITFKKIADVPGALALNGLTTLSGSFSNTLLIGDAKLGAIWSLEISSGISKIVYEDDHFLPTSSIAFGVNGIHVRDERVYFATSANNTFGYVPLNTTTGVFSDENVTIIAKNLPGNEDYDDFALSENGKFAFVADHTENLVRIDIESGEQDVVISGLNGPTAAAFGRGDGCALYVVTGGSSSNGTISSGMVVQVDTCSGNSSRVS